MQVTHTALHYTRELMTTFGLIHTLHHSPGQLGTSFVDHRRLFPTVPDTRPSSSSPLATSMTEYTHPRHVDPGPPSRSTSSTTRPVHGITVTTSHGYHVPRPRLGPRVTSDRSRSRSRLNPR